MHSAELAHIDYFRELAQRIDAGEHGSKGKIIDAAQKMLGLSRQQIYRGLRAVGWSSRRKVRCDRGDSDITDDELRFIVNLMLESTRDNGKQLLAWEDAVAIAVANKHVSSNKHHATYSRVARERGLHPDQLKHPTPYQDMKSLHPNHVWQFDVSLCVLYYMDDKGLEPMDKKKFYQNKPQYMERIKRKRVLRYLMTDHTSGTLFVKYYLGSGEDQETLFEFLMDAFARSEHKQDPFHGVPWLMVWDAGAANQSHLIKNLLQQLGVKHWHHMPGNPRAKGQVEGGHNIVERSFEGRLSMMNIRDIDHLNEAAASWMRWFNGTKVHRRHKNTRYALWQTIREDQLRLAPARAVCEALLQTKPEPRKVGGNLTISFKVKGYDSHVYSVGHVPNIRVGESVLVSVNPYHAPNIFIIEKGEHGDEFITCEPIAMDSNGFMQNAPVWGDAFKAPADTAANTSRKAMLKEAYGVDTQIDVDKARARRDPTFGGDVDPITYMDDAHSSHYMKRKGRDLDMTDAVAVEEQPLSAVAVAKKMLAQGVVMNPTRMKMIKSQYPDGVFEADVEGLVAMLGDFIEDRQVVNGLRVVK